MHLKKCLSTFPILALLDFTKGSFIECDASTHNIGDVFMQDHNLIAYFSKALSDRTLSK